jgi:hypothetical protein
MRVIRAVEGGFSARGAGRRAAAKSQKGCSRSPLQPHPDWLLALIGERADLTLEIVLGERGVRVGVSSVWGTWTGTASALKKAHAAERHCAAVAAARLVWKNLQPQLDPRHLVFLDETGTATNMARLRGRCRGRCRTDTGKQPRL